MSPTTAARFGPLWLPLTDLFSVLQVVVPILKPRKILFLPVEAALQGTSRVETLSYQGESGAAGHNLTCPVFGAGFSAPFASHPL